MTNSADNGSLNSGLASALLSAAAEVNDLVLGGVHSFEKTERGTATYVSELDEVGVDISDP